MKCLIIYKSKSGYTKKYMEMLSELVEATLVELESFNPDILSAYDTVVYAAGVYAGRISGIKKFFKLLGSTPLEKLVIAAVGASPSTNEVRKKLKEDNLMTESVVNTGNIEFFYLQGGFDPKKLNFALRFMLGKASKNLQKKQNKNPQSLTDEDKAFLDYFRTANDQTSKEQLMPIIKFIDTPSAFD